MTTDYVIRIHDDPHQLDRTAWNGLLQNSDNPSPFMQLEYLQALHSSGSAIESTGWDPRFITVWSDEALVAACPLYVKDHSYGEYVFDWAWANAYQSHGLRYYPKGVVAVPFTPVPGSRLLARDDAARSALVQALLAVAKEWQLSSLHLLFADSADMDAAQSHGWMSRQTVQFHWENQTYPSFEAFLGSLRQEKRKKIRQERKKVSEAGVEFQALEGANISEADWDFFYRCYQQTYYEHGNAPYLTPAFFKSMRQTMARNWLMFVGWREGQRVASSLIAIDPDQRVAYGRYWGSVEAISCMHFEACYYQPIQWCIDHEYQRFEGGAQGEHKMARALLPVMTRSAHWLAHPSFADAVDRYLERETQGIDHYIEELEGRSPLKRV